MASCNPLLPDVEPSTKACDFICRKEGVDRTAEPHHSLRPVYAHVPPLVQQLTAASATDAPLEPLDLMNRLPPLVDILTDMPTVNSFTRSKPVVLNLMAGHGGKYTLRNDVFNLRFSNETLPADREAQDALLKELGDAFRESKNDTYCDGDRHQEHHHFAIVNPRMEICFLLSLRLEVNYEDQQLPSLPYLMLNRVHGNIQSVREHMCVGQATLPLAVYHGIHQLPRFARMCLEADDQSIYPMAWPRQPRQPTKDTTSSNKSLQAKADGSPEAYLFEEVYQFFRTEYESYPDFDTTTWVSGGRGLGRINRRYTDQMFMQTGNFASVFYDDGRTENDRAPPLTRAQYKKDKLKREWIRDKLLQDYPRYLVHMDFVIQMSVLSGRSRGGSERLVGVARGEEIVDKVVDTFFVKFQEPFEEKVGKNRFDQSVAYLLKMYVADHDACTEVLQMRCLPEAQRYQMFFQRWMYAPTISSQLSVAALALRRAFEDGDGGGDNARSPPPPPPPPKKKAASRDDDDDLLGHAIGDDAAAQWTYDPNQCMWQASLPSGGGTEGIGAHLQLHLHVIYRLARNARSESWTFCPGGEPGHTRRQRTSLDAERECFARIYEGIKAQVGVRSGGGYLKLIVMYPDLKHRQMLKCEAVVYTCTFDSTRAVDPLRITHVNVVKRWKTARGATKAHPYTAAFTTNHIHRASEVLVIFFRTPT